MSRTEKLPVMTFALLSAVGLSSCHFMTKNISLMRDTVGPAREDVVAVEAGRRSPATSAPQATAAPTKPRKITHKVQSGESISLLAARYKVSQSDLLRANKMTPDQADKIRIGQELIIPR